jgi:sarcosine oxidase
MRAEVIVVGLGAMGAATSWQLARQGMSVLAFDRYAPPHEGGSTHGESRITRLAVGEGDEYVPLVRRSHELWKEIEVESSHTLLTQTGGIVIGGPGSDFLERTRAIAARHGIAHENVDGDELRRQFPMFAVDEAARAYYEPEAGYVRPEAAVAAQLGLAAKAGARLRLGEAVLAWRASPEGVRVRSESGAHNADQLVLCPGAWINQLFPEGRELFAVYRQLMLWFPIANEPPRLGEMPIFVWDFGGERTDFVHLRGFYGFPPLAGSAGGVKVATEQFEHTTEPDGAQHPATPDEAVLMRQRVIGERLPWLGPTPLRTVSCLCTSTRASRFVIDRHPTHENVMIVSACSGHGFKHSPAVGEAVAQWIAAHSPQVDLRPFQPRRLSRARSLRRHFGCCAPNRFEPRAPTLASRLAQHASADRASEQRPTRLPEGLPDAASAAFAALAADRGWMSWAVGLRTRRRSLAALRVRRRTAGSPLGSNLFPARPRAARSA